MSQIKLREVKWIGSSLKDIQAFPQAVRREIGFTLHQIQEGKKPRNVKHLTGLGNGILEIVCDHNKNAYRAVYLLEIDSHIYILHVFQKKSKHGIETPKSDIDLIKSRLITAKKDLKL